MIPQLETDRLLLRAWHVSDFEPYARLVANPEVMRYLGGVPMNRTDAWRNMAMLLGHWTLRGYGMWAVERKRDGALIGRVGLHDPEGWPGLEVGWTLGRDYWGQGYATEAGRAAMRYGFLTQPVERLLSVIDPENMASQRVAERLGETRGERRNMESQGKQFTADIWSIARADWKRKS